MNKLNELRILGYEVLLLPNDVVDIQLPENQELTSKIKQRLDEIKPELNEDLKSEYFSGRHLYRYHSHSTRK